MAEDPTELQQRNLFQCQSGTMILKYFQALFYALVRLKKTLLVPDFFLFSISVRITLGFLCRIGGYKPCVTTGSVLMLSPECTYMGCRHTRDIGTRDKSRSKQRRKKNIFIMERGVLKRNCGLLTFCCLQIKARCLSGKTDFGHWSAVGLCPGQAIWPGGPFRLQMDVVFCCLHHVSHS